MNIKTALTWGAAIFGLTAAALWAYASYQSVAFDPDERDEGGWHPAAIVERTGTREADVIKTAKRQSYWNGLAALAASVAAICQVLLLWCS
jgi:hypothetical protein